MHNNPTGILLMAYGSPERVDELGPYLLDIRGGRPTSEELIAEIRERYLAIGGHSPLLDITRRQAAGLEAELHRRYDGSGTRFKVYVGMRHWEPRIREAVAQMAADGISRAVGLVMAPHGSRLSTGAYFTRLDEAIRDLGPDLEVTCVQSWHVEPELIEALAERGRQALSGFGDAQPYVVFSAHSLPARILAEGDPYDSQLRETSTLLADRLGLKEGRWRFSYQSAGRSPEPWLGPPIEQTVVELAQAGEKNMLIVPVGFVCDHVEILYDIDIACRKLAATYGARLERSESLNDSPSFIRALADVVAHHLA